MRHKRHFGRKPAVEDNRVPHFSSVRKLIVQPPPDNIVWYADVPQWDVLANDSMGDCVEAASLHALQQFLDYAGTPTIPLATDAIDFYSKSQGYNPSDPTTDKGSVTLGPNGTMQYWHDKGITCAGKLNQLQAYMQISDRNPTEWREAIWLFGGLMIGMKVPESILDAPELPFVWNYQQGASIGGLHEVWVNGVTTVVGERFYDIVTWGQHCRLTEEYMMNWLDEVIVLYDKSCLNTSGCDARGLSEAELIGLMGSLR